MELYGRQGDLVVTKLESVSGDLTPAENYVLAGRTSGAPHTLRGKARVRRDGLVTLVSVAEPTQIEHVGRHQALALEPGNYEIRPLRERGGDGDRAVED